MRVAIASAVVVGLLVGATVLSAAILTRRKLSRLVPRAEVRR